MIADKRYDVRELVAAYVDAQRPAYPHEDFRTFRQQRLAALAEPQLSDYYDEM